MTDTDNAKLMNGLSEQYYISKDLIAKMKENSRILITDISNVLDRLGRGDIKPDSEEITQILTEKPTFKSDVDYVKNRLDEIVIRLEELDLDIKLHVKRGIRGRQQIPVENDSAYESATSNIFTESRLVSIELDNHAEPVVAQETNQHQVCPSNQTLTTSSGDENLSGGQHTVTLTTDSDCLTSFTSSTQQSASEATENEDPFSTTHL